MLWQCPCRSQWVFLHFSIPPLLALSRLRSLQLSQGHFLPYPLPFHLKVMNWFHASRRAFCKNSQHPLAPLSTMESSHRIPPNSVLKTRSWLFEFLKPLGTTFNNGYLKLVTFLFLLGYFWAETVLQPGSSQRPKDGFTGTKDKQQRALKILLPTSIHYSTLYSHTNTFPNHKTMKILLK